jgi:ribosomal protein L10
MYDLKTNLREIKKDDSQISINKNNLFRITLKNKGSALAKPLFMKSKVTINE